MDVLRAAIRRRLSGSPDAPAPPSPGASPPSAPQQPSPGVLGLARFMLSEAMLSSPSPTPTPDLALEAVSPRPSEDCPICLQPLDDECSRTPCDHHFHRKCLEAYFVASRGEPG